MVAAAGRGQVRGVERIAMPREGATGALHKETDRQVVAFQERVSRIEIQGHFIAIQLLPDRDDNFRFAAEEVPAAPCRREGCPRWTGLQQ